MEKHRLNVKSSGLARHSIALIGDEEQRNGKATLERERSCVAAEKLSVEKNSHGAAILRGARQRNSIEKRSNGVAMQSAEMQWKIGAKSSNGIAKQSGDWQRKCIAKRRGAMEKLGME